MVDVVEEVPVKVGSIARSNSKRGLRKKGSSSNVSETAHSPSPGEVRDASVAGPSSEVGESKVSEANVSGKTAVSGVSSPQTLNLAINMGRRQKLSVKTKSNSGVDESEGKDLSARSGDNLASPRKDWSVSPRATPNYQAAVAADPSLTYIPTRVYLVTDVNFMAVQANLLQPATQSPQAKQLEWVALSVGRLWNLHTFLLIAGEKLGVTAQAIFLKSRLARIISIHDLREDDELILCSHLEGPFALIERKEAPPFVRLSPRQRLNSAPSDPMGLATSNQSPTAALKSESAPKSRPTSSSVAVPPLSASTSQLESPTKTALKSPSPPHRDGSLASDALATPGRKKSKPVVVNGLPTASPSASSIPADDIASNGSQSPSKSVRKLKTNPSASTTSAASSAGSFSSAMSSSTESLERLRNDPNYSPGPKSARSRSKLMSKQGSGGSASSSSELKISHLRIVEETRDVYSPNAIYSTPITSQLPFEGCRLIRRDSTSFLDTMRSEDIKTTAIAAIKEHDRTICVSPDHPVIAYHGDTSKTRNCYTVEVLYLELKRSRSLPDVWLNSSRRRKWGPISSGLVGDGSTTSTASTFRDEDGDFSDDDSSSLTSSTNTDLEGKDVDDRDLHPLTMSEEDVRKRMAYEEKQDQANLVVMDNEVQAGTLRALIRRLFWEYQNDDFVQHFLLTYDLFVNHLSLLKTLIMLFRVPITDSAATAKTSPGTPTMSSRRQLKFTTLRKGDTDAPSSPRGGSRDSLTKETAPRSTDAAEMDREPADSISSLASSSMNASSTASLGMKLVIQHRILTTIKQWVELRYDILSLKTNRAFFTLFNEFCEYLSQAAVDKHRMAAKMLLQAVKTAKYNRLMMRQQIELSKPPSAKASTMAASSTKAATKITDISVQDWAVYFTLREQSYYGRVKLKEYHMANMGSKDMAKKSPHLTKLINHFNKLSMWVATAIFRCEGFPDSTPRARATVISHFLKIMEELRVMQNFSSMMAIYSSLSIIPIERLEKTWSHVSSEDRALLLHPARLRESNYKAYREKLEVSEPPCMPIQEILIKDLTLIEENPTILDNGWINFSKIFMLGKAYKAIKRSQTSPYTNKYPAGVYTFHKLHDNMTLEALYDLSKLVEPSANDLERIARAESEKREAEKREKKFRDLIAKYSRKFPSKTDLLSLFGTDTTLEQLVTQQEACAIFYVHLQQICENSSLDYYRVWCHDWKGLSPKNTDRLKEVAARIYDTYLSPASESAISLKLQSSRQTVFKAVKGSDPLTIEIFEPINSEVRERLKPLLLDFKRSLEVK